MNETPKSVSSAKSGGKSEPHPNSEKFSGSNPKGCISIKLTSKRYTVIRQVAELTGRTFEETCDALMEMAVQHSQEVVDESREEIERQLFGD